MTTPVIARRWTNWGGNQQAHATEILTPGTVDEVAAQVKEASGSGRRVKVVGSGHSFTAIAVATDQRLFLHRLAGLVSIDGPLVTVQAGMPLHVLNALLAEHGLAMPNLGDIDQQTVAGAISTGTHGTGASHSTLASCVEGVKLVTGSGEVLEVGKDDPVFPAVRLGLGALGILVEVTLRCTEAFTLLADERPMPLADVLAGLDEWIPANDHVEFYWYPYTDRAQLKINNKVPAHDRPLTRFRGWMDDEFLSNTVFGAVKLLHAAAGAFHRDGVRDPARGAARGHLGAAPDHRRAAVQGAVPGRGAVHRPGRRLAVPRVRAGLRVRGRAPVHRGRVRAVLPGRRGGLPAARRAAALGQAALPRGRGPAPGLREVRRLRGRARPP
jgi:FAD/FMN-containing dehydrogenase